jgi:proteasome lid subunit RPN8/RPN11
MNVLSNGLYIDKTHWAQMEADVETRAPEEACGLVVGEGNHSRLVIPVTNILHNQSRFRMEPKEQLNAFLLAEEKKMDILAVYHSHPQGLNKPSVTDFEELTYPGIIYLIWCIVGERWSCQGYLMYQNMEAIEVPVIVIEEV